MWDIMSWFYRNLLFLKHYDGDVTDLGLDFTVLNRELGQTEVSDYCDFNSQSIKHIIIRLIFLFMC